MNKQPAITEPLPAAGGRRRFLKSVGASAVAAPLLAKAAPAMAEEETEGLDEGGTIPEIVVEEGENNASNTPSLKPDYVGVHSLNSEPAVLVVNEEPITLPFDCAGKTTDSRRASVLHRMENSGTYEVKGTAGKPVALNTKDGKAQKRSNEFGKLPQRVERLLDLPNYYSRSAWGGDDVEDLRFDEEGNDRWGSDPSFYPIQKITVHHSATENNDPDPLTRVNAIYQFHTIERNFGDIGYNLLIDESGSLYEGRYSGDFIVPSHTLEIDGLFGAVLRGVQGAHVGGFNSGNFGIALLGDFTQADPTTASLETLQAVLALLCVIHDLDPNGSSTYVNPVSEASVDIDNIAAHLQWSATECPGALLDLLPEIRTNVAALIDSIKDPRILF